MVDARRTFYENAMENEDDKHTRCLEIGQTTGVYIALIILSASKEHKTNFRQSHPTIFHAGLFLHLLGLWYVPLLWMDEELEELKM